MKIKDIAAVLWQAAPPELAEPWDNSGLSVGSLQEETEAVVIALDVTAEVIEAAEQCGARLIVTHHPLIFDPLKCLPSDHLVYRLARAGMAALSCHTNLDKAAGGVNDALAAALGLREVTVAPDGMARIGVLPQEVTAGKLAETAAAALHTAVRLRAGSRPIRTVAVCGGAGAELVLPLLQNGADAAVTGEAKHHEWLAVPAGTTLIDAGHYATEAVVLPLLEQRLRAAFPALPITVLTDRPPYVTEGKTHGH